MSFRDVAESRTGLQCLTDDLNCETSWNWLDSSSQVQLDSFLPCEMIMAVSANIRVSTEGNWRGEGTQGRAENKSHCITKRLRRYFPTRNISDCPGHPNTSVWARPCCLQRERAVLRDRPEVRLKLKRGGRFVPLSTV